jgi:EAL and modified HD-GYP domain-containing signal transduction protein
MDKPLSDLLATLPLAPDITRALLHQEGILGATLHCVLAYEHGDWEAVKCPEVEPETITAAYLEAIAWSGTISNALTTV